MGKRSTRYQGKCFESWKHKALEKAKREDYLFPSRGHGNLHRGGGSQAEAIKGMEAVPGKGLRGRFQR